MNGLALRLPVPRQLQVALPVFLLAMGASLWASLAPQGPLRPTARHLYRRWKQLRLQSALAGAHQDARRLAMEVTVQVDPAADRHPISPLIYGVAHAPEEEPGALAAVGARLHRWGGNTNTRHNWVMNAWNSARDWEWRSHGQCDKPPSFVADGFVRRSQEAGAAVLMSVPAMGWVARSCDKNVCSQAVPDKGGAPLPGAIGAIAGYDPTANRLRTSARSLARKGKPFELSPRPGPVVYQDEWVYHLVKTFGTAAHGGVRFYAIDNEPELWSSTHTDVHPAQMGYDDLLATFLEYAGAIKAVDPAAQVTGPVSWGWTGYFYSALDAGVDNFATHADRKRHGDEPFVLWFLKQVQAQDRRVGRRTLDVLDIHHYPQAGGVHSEKADAATQELRLRSTRSWWDPSYTDESWIAEPVRLLPRAKEWIAQGYPGTKLGISEWSFGAEEDISGGLATAETLGILGREDVYLASYWTCPRAGSFSRLAFALFGDTDARGKRRFGDLSCRARSGAPTQVSSFAALETDTGDLTLLLINKLPRATATVPVQVAGWRKARAGQQWRLSAQTPGKLVSSPAPALVEGRATFLLPPYSATLVRFSRE